MTNSNCVNLISLYHLLIIENSKCFKFQTVVAPATACNWNTLERLIRSEKVAGSNVKISNKRDI